MPNHDFIIVDICAGELSMGGEFGGEKYCCAFSGGSVEDTHRLFQLALCVTICEVTWLFVLWGGMICLAL